MIPSIAALLFFFFFFFTIAIMILMGFVNLDRPMSVCVFLSLPLAEAIVTL